MSLNMGPRRRPPTWLTSQEEANLMRTRTTWSLCSRSRRCSTWMPLTRLVRPTFMRGRFNPRASGPPRPGAPPANRGPAGRFTGAAQGSGGFRAADVAPRLPPRDAKDMSCVNRGKKDHGQGLPPSSPRGQAEASLLRVRQAGTSRPRLSREAAQDYRER